MTAVRLLISPQTRKSFFLLVVYNNLAVYVKSYLKIESNLYIQYRNGHITQNTENGIWIH